MTVSILESEQKALLFRLIEAERSLPQAQRESFTYAPTFGRSVVEHPALGDGLEVFDGDLRVLEASRFILFTGKHFFTITPQAQAFYRDDRAKSVQPVEDVQSEMLGFLNSQEFQNRHEKAFKKWHEAYTKLQGQDNTDQVAVIGHLCREASQYFASELINLYSPEDYDDDVAKVKNRVRAVVAHQRPSLGERNRSWLDALLTLWEKVIDLIQQHEHALQKAGEPLTWEDSRRVVFQTAVCLFEIDRLLLTKQ